MKESEEEYLSIAYNTKNKDDDKRITMRTVHANKMNTVPTGCQANNIKEFVDIGNKTNQSSKIMNFLPIDHDTPIL